MSREVAHVFQQVDVLIAPTLKYAPRTIKYYQERDAADKPFPPEIWNTWLFNIFGLPAMSVPCGFTSAGLPIGVMIAGAPFGDQCFPRAA
jgi:aspartyl-tRNA(Asn)/glutamyl-tRNA(Gln) amidotransferase subunit A